MGLERLWWLSIRQGLRSSGMQQQQQRDPLVCLVRRRHASADSSAPVVRALSSQIPGTKFTETRDAKKERRRESDSAAFGFNKHPLLRTRRRSLSST